MSFLSYFVTGISLGSIYALIALGYTMVYGIAKMLNFAHGDVIMIGGYVAYTAMSTLHFPVWISVCISIISCIILGVLIEKIAYKPLRNASPLAILITAIGVSYLLQNVALLIFGSAAKSFTSVVPRFSVGKSINLNISGETIVTIAVTVLIVIALSLFISKTRSGRAMLAVSEDKGAAQLMGVNVNRTISLTFVIGSALAGIAAVLYAAKYQNVDPYTGSVFGIKAFAAAVFGGIGSIPGAMIGGFSLGLIEALTIGFLPDQMSAVSDGVAYGLLILMLILKPSGLLGKKHIEKV